MKSNLLFLLVLLCSFLSCEISENDFPETVYPHEVPKNGFSSEELMSYADSPEPDMEILPNETIVEYYPNVSDERREELRSKYQVVSYRTCDCSGNTRKYELWTFHPSVGVEPTVRVIKEGDDVIDIARISRNFSFWTPMHSLVSIESGDKVKSESINGTFNDLYLGRIKAKNSGVTVAVIDTGIDVNFPGFSSSFLYNSSNNNLCAHESGWDFVNHDSNPFDDYARIHGTVVSYIIHNELSMKGVDHQILPIKVADANGVATFFDTLCGLSYAIEIQADVINMSLGWYGSDSLSNNMFSSLIDSTSSTIVTSAGNRSNNNDALAHYPSGFSQDHVLAIAATKSDLKAAAAYSNFGATSVDFYAVGDNIPFPLWTANRYANFTGTSFATPLVTARVAELVSYKNYNVRTTLIDRLGVDVRYSKPVSYKKRIP